ncbi:MAG: hypothetical protein JKY81_07760 [Colwellia sp.]|nr:hypothetical protein [Colwellia sp.]
MQATVHQREALLERRQHDNIATDTLWNKLSLAQKFAASSLAQFGYDLTYIRNSHTGNLAILLCNDNAATISTEGEIDTSPNIVIRD